MAPSSIFERGLSAEETRKANKDNFNPIINGRTMRPPLRTIYIFSVAKRDFTVKSFLFPKLTLQGCHNGERVVRCTSIPDPVVQISPDIERGGSRPDEHDGWLMALDMLRPDHVANGDPYSGSDNPDFSRNRNGTNLIAEGLFPSLNETPTEQEIKRAEQLRDRRYRWLTGEAKRLGAISRKDLNEFLQQNPDTHVAMDALGMTAEWHTSNLMQIACPNCGDSIKEGLAFHQSSAGVLCVLDPDRAFKAGAITRARMKELKGEE